MIIMFLCILLYHFHRIYDCRKNFVRLDQFKDDNIVYKYFKDKYGTACLTLDQRELMF